MIVSRQEKELIDTLSQNALAIQKVGNISELVVCLPATKHHPAAQVHINALPEAR